MMLPGKGWPVSGSRMVTGLPLLFTLCEKLPWRSSAVGTRVWCRLFGDVRRWYSWLKKKNSFFLSSLNPGKLTGPPNVYPESLREVFGGWIAGVLRLFRYVLASQLERRPYQ